MSETIALAVLVKTAGYVFGILMSGCCTNRRRCVSYHKMLQVNLLTLLQTASRQRGSISSRLPILQRAETQGTSTSRLRSDSVVSGVDAEENTIDHPVEPRSRTAILPPVLTKLADKHPLSWIDFTEEAIVTSCKTGKCSYHSETDAKRILTEFDLGHIRTWSRPADSIAQTDL